MKHFVLIVCAFFVCIAEAVDSDLKQTIDDAIDRVKPALVQIHVVSVSYQNGREIKQEGAGSGVIVTEDGYVLSNHHVAGHAKRLICTLSDNEEIVAELVGTDALSDISVLKLKPRQPRKFSYAEFGNSDEVQVGDTVLAMGSPMALSQSVTLGIISNTKMVMPQLFWPFNRFTLDGEDVGSIVRWIAHDAAIYGGNSGGPLVDLEGKVIGINEISFGLSGAIPGNMAWHIGQQIIQHGAVTRAWVGLDVQPLLKQSGLQQGVHVSGTIKNSPAEKAGFKAGDVLVKLNGREVRAKFQEEIPLFNRIVADLPIGQEIDVDILREGESQRLKVTPIAREEVLPDEIELKQWGVTVRDISSVLAQELKLKTRDGVLVTSTRPGGPGDEATPSLAERDVITRIDDQAVLNADDFIRITEEITKDKEKPVPVLVNFFRNNQEFITVVRVGIREIEDPGLEVKKAWLPISYQVLCREIADHTKQPEIGGVRVTQVYADSTAEKAGLKVGDIITKLDGEQIPAYQPEDHEVFTALIRQYAVGAKPELTLLRDEKEMSITVELIRAPKLAREMKQYRDEHFEFSVRELSFFDKVEESWREEQTGLLVTEVVPGGWAAVSHLANDDLILDVNGKLFNDVGEFEKEMDAIAEEKPETIVFGVLRGIHHLYLEMEPQWKEN